VVGMLSKLPETGKTMTTPDRKGGARKAPGSASTFNERAINGDIDDWPIALSLSLLLPYDVWCGALRCVYIR